MSPLRVKMLIKVQGDSSLLIAPVDPRTGLKVPIETDILVNYFSDP